MRSSDADHHATFNAGQDPHVLATLTSSESLSYENEAEAEEQQSEVCICRVNASKNLRSVPCFALPFLFRCLSFPFLFRRLSFPFFPFSSPFSHVTLLPPCWMNLTNIFAFCNCNSIQHGEIVNYLQPSWDFNIKFRWFLACHGRETA